MCCGEVRKELYLAWVEWYPLWYGVMGRNPKKKDQMTRKVIQKKSEVVLCQKLTEVKDHQNSFMQHVSSL